MSIGYACLTVGIDDANFKTCRLANATDDRLRELIEHNLASLNKLIDYNIQNDVKLFRISSDIVPFGSHPINELAWWEEFEENLALIGEKAKNHGMRLSMHPGQYTVLNSKNSEVVKNAIGDLSYHTRFMNALGLDKSHKIILHVGGAYGDKEASLKRFADNYQYLDQGIKDRLIVENDDKIFNIEEVLSLATAINAPVVYDNLHNQVNSSAPFKSDLYWIQEAGKTWSKEDGRQKIHYSQQNLAKQPGAHTETINAREFVNFYENVQGQDLDIMLEVKDKNLSAIKIINATSNGSMKDLEKEWARYKYLILEHSPQIYQAIRQLLKDKRDYPVLAFYDLIDQALSQEPETGHAINAAQHVWGYFKKDASPKVKAKIDKEMAKLAETGSALSLKRSLWKLAKEHEESYLLENLYFKDIIK